MRLDLRAALHHTNEILMTRTGAAGRPDLEERTESFFEWVTANTRQLVYGALAILAVAVIALFWVKSRESRAISGERKLLEAEQALGSGNEAMAQKALEETVSRFSGTPAAKQASLILVQVLFDRGQYAQGVARLDKLDGGDAYMAAAIENLKAIGFEQQSKFADAADHYKKAAALTPFESDKMTYLANAGRALMSTTNRDEAIKVWSQLAADPTSAIAAEARVRLGELEARPAARS